uniref:Uncharacterized protein n=1 Tax=Loxodonta africana TaxID=9785 RepID=G3UJ19_LOXAF
MGNLALCLSCLEEWRSCAGARPRNPPPPAASQALLPPRISWAWCGPHSVELSEVMEVMEMVVMKGVQRGSSCGKWPPALVRLPTGCRLAGLRVGAAGLLGALAPNATAAASQLREQELLQHLLRERGPQRLQEAKNTEELRAQWERLVRQAEARSGLLWQIVLATQNFGAACRALLAELRQGWLGPGGHPGAMQCLQLVFWEAASWADDSEQVLENSWRLVELLAGTVVEAQLVRGQLQQLQEWAQLAGDGAVCVQQELLWALELGPLVPSLWTGLGVQLKLEGAASEHQGLKSKNRMLASPQRSVKLAWLSERLKQLTQHPSRSRPSHWAPWDLQGLPYRWCVARPRRWAWGPQGSPVSPAVLQAVGVPPGDLWSEAQEQDIGFMWGAAQGVWRGPVELAVLEEDLRWNSWLWAHAGAQSPRGGGGAVHSGGVSYPSAPLYPTLAILCPPHPPALSRPPTLEKTSLFAGHLEELLMLLPRLCSAVPCGTEVMLAQPGGPVELPRILGTAGLKHWTRAPGEGLDPKGLNQRWSGGLGSRASA